MKTPTRITIAMASLALLVAADATAQRSREEYDDGFKAGFKEGYSKGYREGLEEGERRGAGYAPPPPPPKAGPNGPITITNAYYGTDKRNCNATHWLGRRANGRMNASVEVENSICGDPAPGQRKSLEVTYLCGTFAKTASSYEHRPIFLDCSS